MFMLVLEYSECSMLYTCSCWLEMGTNMGAYGYTGAATLWHGYMGYCGVSKFTTIPILSVPILETLQVFLYPCQTLQAVSTGIWQVICRYVVTCYPQVSCIENGTSWKMSVPLPCIEIPAGLVGAGDLLYYALHCCVEAPEAFHGSPHVVYPCGSHLRCTYTLVFP